MPSHEECKGRCGIAHSQFVPPCRTVAAAPVSLRMSLAVGARRPPKPIASNGGRGRVGNSPALLQRVTMRMRDARLSDACLCRLAMARTASLLLLTDSGSCPSVCCPSKTHKSNAKIATEFSREELQFPLPSNLLEMDRLRSKHPQSSLAVATTTAAVLPPTSLALRSSFVFRRRVVFRHGSH
jgi:hypothetical protein